MIKLSQDLAARDLNKTCQIRRRVSPCILFLAATMATLARAQILNPDFEAWPTCLCDPPGWATNNIYLPPEFIIVGPGEPHAGNFGIAAWVDSSIRFNQLIAPTITSERFQLDFRSQALHGFFMFRPVAGDQFTAAILLYNDTTLVGEGRFADSTMAPSYVEFVANIQYRSEDMPDAAVIRFTIAASLRDGKLHRGSRMSIDMLSLEGASSVDFRPPNSPTGFQLLQNHPNPPNPMTTIQYTVAQGCRVRLELYDISGRRVSTLVDEWKRAGEHRLSLDTRHLASGAYVYRLITDQHREARRLLVVR